MKKLLITITLITAAIATYVIARSNSDEKISVNTTNSKPTIKIGASLPLTGNLAPIGNAIKDALLMAQDELPANTKYNYEIIFDDDNYELKKIANNANRQISVEKVDAILSLFDGAASIISPIAEKNKIPNIGCTWGAEFFKSFDYSFNHWSRPETQSEAFINLLKNKQIKSFAVMMINYASSQEMIKHIEQKAKENNINITSVNIINNGTKDFRITLEKIRHQNPEAIMLQMLDPELGIFTKQAHEAGLKIPYVAIDQLPSAQNMEYIEGSEFVLSRDGTEEFKTNLAKRSNLPALSCIANLYDAFNILVKTYETSDTKPTGEQVKEKLYQITDYPSVLGVKIKVDNDGIIDSPLVRAQIKDAKVIIKE